MFSIFSWNVTQITQASIRRTNSRGTLNFPFCKKSNSRYDSRIIYLISVCVIIVQTLQ